MINTALTEIIFGEKFVNLCPFVISEMKSEERSDRKHNRDCGANNQFRWKRRTAEENLSSLRYTHKDKQKTNRNPELWQAENGI